MTDTLLLQKKIKDSGLKLSYIAKQLNLSRFGLSKKINNESSFKAEEIQILCELLKIEDYQIKERIFFTSNVGK